MFFLFLASVISTFRPDHGVSLSVVAPWYGVPLFEQLLFYISDFSLSSAQAFLQETLVSSGNLENSEYLWDKAQSVLTPDAIPLMKAQVEVGYFLPRAEMFREIAREFGGSNYPDLMVTGSLDNFSFTPDLLFPSNYSSYYEYDIVFGSSTNYIYANLHNETVAKIVLSLLQSETPFILRPTSKTEKFGINLRGFGIEMRPFKYSMEYGVKDTIVLDTANAQNDTLKDYTVKNIHTIPESYIDPSNYESIGVKLAAYFREQGGNPIEHLRDITNNYPLYLPKIVSSEVLPEDISAYNKVFRMYSENSKSLINGRNVPIKNLDIFSLLDMINQEQNFRTVLESHYKMDIPLIRSLSTIQLKESSDYLIDYRSNMIRYLNDIEKDQEYSSLSKDISDIFNSMTGLPMVRKNLINLIFIGNPLSLMGSQALLSLSYLVEQSFPGRVGIAPFFNLADRLSRKVAFAFHHISQKSHKNAIKFLINAIAAAQTNNEESIKLPTESMFARAFNDLSRATKDVITWNEIHRLYDPSSEESHLIEETNKYIKKLGVKTDTLLINGQSVQIESLFSQAILMEIQKAVQIVQGAIYESGYRAIPNKHIIDILADFYTVVPSLDVQIFSEKPQSLGLLHQSLAHQIEFIQYFNEVEWNATDKGLTSSFFILFCPEGTDTSVFEEFMKKNHSIPTSFAINPPFPESIYRAQPDMCTLLVNGRIFENFDITNIAKLQMIDVWSKLNIYESIKPHISSIKYKRREALAYLSCIITDWIAEDIERLPIQEHAWQTNSRLVYHSNNAGMHWDLIVNPFTREYQRIADIVNYVNNLKVIDVRIAIIPPADLASDLTTISTYYRNSLATDQAFFTMLNDTTTYSSMPDMPITWIFESMKASVDLDNILLKELSTGTHEGIYVLTNIMAEGICYTDKGEFAEGAELALLDSDDERKSDTIVMMSNGYWQLPANPGRFKVELGGKRSKMVYEMITRNLVVSTFASSLRKIYVKVNKGMEGLKVYNVTVTDTSNTTRVDVFSVASGHLYERLLKIMMLAVRRRSNYNVKFWIIKAFLSPQFKATLPIMSKKYNFSYQLVSYKWPTWLYPQYEKQRIIWGNKILFLDVIFPLDLERVIYVDSDQIVRTDLIELMRMDFGDAPYAFTPFCDSRKETEPFRFWKKGYWKELLGKKKYHISALFAIDLRRFRQMAAGDWLRYHYQQLSSDPNSLANLDQDLPNYAQIHIPIYSLPQNWLWCETWCSDETMDQAKTIDLCNNPLTKKPKLYVAQTMVKEWPALDEEVRNISAGPDDYQKFFFQEE
ncbi:glycosyl transferase [Tritrichomonas foetus]|uniref:Glycosyl transferase n=1 Tax=Tritrichomonas foetus TaxID=1144522 RepID=A0A1J4K0U3_9EUKA|nr:glycosyl transferase [Tritrichomonas foetus]|eukprot:OHT03366.1 glycosyl transferase [Tritrichomonas foetus]